MWWVIFVSAVGGLLVAYVVRIALSLPLPVESPPPSPGSWTRVTRAPAAQVRHLDSIMKNFAATCSIVFSTAVSIPLFGFAVDMDFAVGAISARWSSRSQLGFCRIGLLHNRNAPEPGLTWIPPPVQGRLWWPSASCSTQRRTSWIHRPCAA